MSERDLDKGAHGHRCGHCGQRWTDPDGDCPYLYESICPLCMAVAAKAVRELNREVLEATGS